MASSDASDDDTRLDHYFYSSPDRGDILAGLDRGGVGEIQIGMNARLDWASFFTLDVEVPEDLYSQSEMTCRHKTTRREPLTARTDGASSSPTGQGRRRSLFLRRR